MLNRASLLFAILLLNFPLGANALNNIDKFIVNNGVSACNGEGPNCRDFYRKAVELNDDRRPVSPEIRF